MAKEIQENVVWRAQDGPQTALLTSDCDEILYGGARGGGKSDGLLGDVLYHIAQNPRHAKAIIFRRSLPELSDLIDRAREIFLPVGAGYATSKKTFRFPGGAWLRFAYLERLDDAMRYKGQQFTYIGIEEAGDWETDLDHEGNATQKAVLALRATMRSAMGVKKRMVLTANPGGPGHDWVKAWYMTGHEPMTPFHDDIAKVWKVYIPSKLSDNKILQQNDPDYEAKLASSGPPWLVRAWLMGDWNAKQEGAIFDTTKIKRLSIPPKFDYIFQAWDTAFKVGQDNDFTAGFVFGALKSELFLIDCFRRRVEFPQLKQVIRDMATRWPSREILIEDKASGQSLLQELRRETNLNVVPVKIGKGDDKVSRANAVLAFIDAGRVSMPTDAPWAKDFLEELSLFPNAPHDDMVDAFVHGIIRYTQGRGHVGLMDYYREQAEALKREREEKNA